MNKKVEVKKELDNKEIKKETQFKKEKSQKKYYIQNSLLILHLIIPSYLLLMKLEMLYLGHLLVLRDLKAQENPHLMLHKWQQTMLVQKHMKWV